MIAKTYSPRRGMSHMSSHFGRRNLASSVTTTTSADPAVATTVPREAHQLVSAAQAGCRTSFDELVHLYSRRIYRTIFAITKNPEDAEDAMQESFLRAFSAINRFEGRANFYSWLTRIAINTSLMVLRRRRTRPVCDVSSVPGRDEEMTPVDVKDPAPSPEEIFYRRQRRGELHRAIHALPPKLQQIVQEYLGGACSIKELAEKLEISDSAAKSRLNRARARLTLSPHLRVESRVQVVSRSLKQYEVSSNRSTRNAKESLV